MIHEHENRLNQHSTKWQEIIYTCLGDIWATFRMTMASFRQHTLAIAA